MDIDCDGANNSAGDCANDPTGQGQTSFVDTVSTYGISDLDANLHPFVVFGNGGASPSFNPQDHGMSPLSVMAVVCNGQVVSLCLTESVPPCLATNSLTRLWWNSSTVFGGTPMALHPPEKHLLHSANYASPMTDSLAIMAMMRKMYFTSASLVIGLSQARTVPAGLPEARLTLRLASRIWATSLLQAW